MSWRIWQCCKLTCRFMIITLWILNGYLLVLCVGVGCVFEDTDIWCCLPRLAPVELVTKCAELFHLMEHTAESWSFLIKHLAYKMDMYLLAGVVCGWCLCCCVVDKCGASTWNFTVQVAFKMDKYVCNVCVLVVCLQTLISGRSVDDNHWHTVHIRRRAKKVEFRVDREEPIKGRTSTLVVYCNNQHWIVLFQRNVSLSSYY